MKTKFLNVLILAIFFYGCEKGSPPKLSSITVQNSNNLYPGNVVQFEANLSVGDEADEYIWDFGDNTTGRGKSVTHQYQNSGQYGVQVKAVHSCGEDTETTIVTVKEEKGSIYFWTNTNVYGFIYVTLLSTTRTISTFYFQFPGCVANQGLASFSNLPWGTYNFTAVSYNGYTWGGTVTLTDNCEPILLN
jgi:PKD repeat protein